MENFSIPGVGGILEKSVNGIEYILIQDRYKNSAPMEKGLIEIPAGKIREYENIFDCLRREIYEETGLEVVEIKGERESQICETDGYRVVNYTPFSCSQNIKGYYPIMVQVFICKASGDLSASSSESKNIRWISLSSLKELMDKELSCFYPMHISTLKKYLELKAAYGRD